MSIAITTARLRSEQRVGDDLEPDAPGSPSRARRRPARASSRTIAQRVAGVGDGVHLDGRAGAAASAIARAARADADRRRRRRARPRGAPTARVRVVAVRAELAHVAEHRDPAARRCRAAAQRAQRRVHRRRVRVVRVVEHGDAVGGLDAAPCRQRDRRAPRDARRAISSSVDAEARGAATATPSPRCAPGARRAAAPRTGCPPSANDGLQVGRRARRRVDPVVGAGARTRPSRPSPRVAAASARRPLVVGVQHRDAAPRAALRAAPPITVGRALGATEVLGVREADVGDDADLGLRDRRTAPRRRRGTAPPSRRRRRRADAGALSSVIGSPNSLLYDSGLA